VIGKNRKRGHVMTTPPEGDYQVAPGALRADAAAWQQAGATIDTVEKSVAGLTLTAAQFSCWVDAEGVTATYAAVRDKVDTLLGEAAGNFQDIGATLLEVAQTYSATEAAVTGDFTKPNIYGK
jgi:hypothetical protein